MESAKAEAEWSNPGISAVGTWHLLQSRVLHLGIFSAFTPPNTILGSENICFVAYWRLFH